MIAYQIKRVHNDTGETETTEFRCGRDQVEDNVEELNRIQNEYTYSYVESEADINIYVVNNETGDENFIKSVKTEQEATEYCQSMNFLAASDGNKKDYWRYKIVPVYNRKYRVVRVNSEGRRSPMTFSGTKSQAEEYAAHENRYILRGVTLYGWKSRYYHEVEEVPEPVWEVICVKNGDDTGVIARSFNDQKSAREYANAHNEAERASDDPQYCWTVTQKKG